MTDIGSSVIAKLKREGNEFEILVDCDKAMQFKEGSCSLDDALVTFDIFKDVKKGEHASEHEIEKIFGVKDKRKVAEIILKKGDIQLTTEYKNKLREQKKKQIITLISRNSINPKTNLPHPPQRIENALKEVKVHIDEFKNAEEQIQNIIKQLTSVLAISYELKKLSIKIPAEFAGKSYSTFKRYATILKEDWLNDGSLSIEIEVPAGLQNELLDNLNNIVHGKIEISEVKKN
jgi:ribosome maturation protein SDO1